MRRSLREFHVTLDDGLEHQFLEVTFHLVVNLVGQTQTGIVHREQETLDFQFRVQFALDNLDGIEKFRDTLQCKILTLHGDNHRVGCRQCIDRDEAKRRRAVDENIVVFVFDGSKQIADHLLTVLDVEHFNFRTHQVDVARYDVQSFNVGRVHRLAHVGMVDDTLVE